MYLDTNNRLHGAGSLSMVCPHCKTHSHLTPSTAPQFATLYVGKATTAGMVYQCDSCKAPVFLSYLIRKIDDQRIDLDPNPQLVDQPSGQFSFRYIPEPVAASFREAMACHQNELFQAFATMCRLTAQTMFDELGEGGKLRVFDEVEQIIRLTDLEDEIAGPIRDILFDDSPQSLYFPGGLDRTTCAVLIEVMKDILHQIYARFGRLRKAVKMRQFFAEPHSPAPASDNDENTTKIAAIHSDRTTGTNRV